MSENALLQALVDRAAISDLIHRYCRAVDRLDVALGYSIWHDDALADYGAAVYQGPGRGVIDHICAQHRGALHHAHLISNIMIDLDGDRAGSEASHFATLRVARGETIRQISVWGRYIDRWSRRDGRWALDHRLVIRDFDEIRDVVPLSADTLGRRDRDDPSYAVLRG